MSRSIGLCHQYGAKLLNILQGLTGTTDYGTQWIICNMNWQFGFERQALIQSA
jgi:hypothetical protein